MGLFEGAEIEEARHLEVPQAHPATPTPVGASPNDTEPPPTPSVVDFSKDIHGEASERIFYLEDDQFKTLRWSFNDSDIVKPRQLEWRARPNSGSQYQLISNTSLSASQGGFQGLDTYFLRHVNGYSVTLNLGALQPGGLPSKRNLGLGSDQSATGDSLQQAPNLGQEMVIHLDWTIGETVGSSQSGIFSVASKSWDSLELHYLQSNMTSWLVNSVENNGNQTTGQAAATPAGTNTSSTPGAGANPGPEGSPGPAGSPGAEGSPSSQGTGGSSGSGGGGLSTGAIAGIAVGGGVALILIVAGLFWLVLRRRRQKMQETAYAPKQKTSSGYMEDKDLHTQHAAESPRSPLSEDGRAPQIGAVPVPSSHGHGAVSHSITDNAGYAPYRADTAGSRDDVSGAADHNGHRAAPSQGVPHAVAHLVEDGMTADEIRRLEEEERQLDAEIERAGRH